MVLPDSQYLCAMRNPVPPTSVAQYLAAMAMWLLLLLLAFDTHAASTARLPAWVCDATVAAPSPPLLARMSARPFPFASTTYREPSGGSGGVFPGRQLRSVQTGTPPVQRNYYAYIPDDYPARAPYPVLLALHGAAGAGTVSANARNTRDDWVPVAEARGFIVAVPKGTGSNGGWLPATDYPTMAATLHDLAGHYDIDTSRIYAWGFSAGGHVLHDIMLNQHLPDLGSDTFAGYAVSGGTMQAYACNSVSSCMVLLQNAPRRIPVALRIGTSDPNLSSVRIDRDYMTMRGWVAGDTLNYLELDAGHQVVPSSFDGIWDFLCPFQRIPDAVAGERTGSEPANRISRDAEREVPSRIRSATLRRLESRKANR